MTNRIKDPKLKAEMAERRTQRETYGTNREAKVPCPRCEVGLRFVDQPYCNACFNAYVRERRRKQNAHLRVCPDCGGESHRVNSRCKACSKANRLKLVREGVSRWAAKPENRIKIRAHGRVRWAKKTGKIPWEAPCEVCGEMTTTTHHDDYEKPLAVRFLCEQHHKEVHA